MDPFERIAVRIEELGAISDEAGRLTRTFLSPAMDRVHAILGSWMQEAGLTVEKDGWGNCIGRLSGAHAQAGTLILGSHLDTVRNAGKFDGPAGLLTALAALEDLAARRVALPYDIEIISFSDEEGVRFGTPYLGSKAVTGQLTAADLALRDREGVMLAEAAGTTALPASRYAGRKLLGYVEAHIEQGPVLERLGFPLGVVTHIAAQTRLEVTFRGHAGHAGTTPMEGRQDALCAAAAFILAVEEAGRKTPGLVATVGRLHVAPNAGNVIPGEVILSVDLRHADAGVVSQARVRLEEQAVRCGAARNVEAGITLLLSQNAVDCGAALTEGLAHAVTAVQSEAPRLVSGAGHDGVILSHLAPVAMLFIRCRDGLSHHPDEYASPADLAAAGKALARFLEAFTP
jgi:allantoate deiminase